MIKLKIFFIKLPKSPVEDCNIDQNNAIVFFSL